MAALPFLRLKGSKFEARRGPPLPQFTGPGPLARGWPKRFVIPPVNFPPDPIITFPRSAKSTAFGQPPLQPVAIFPTMLNF